MNKKKVLFLTAFYPTFNQQAGQMLSQNLIHDLSINNDIDLVVITRNFVDQKNCNKFSSSTKIIKTNFVDKLFSLVLSILLLLPFRIFSRFSIKLIGVLINLDQQFYNKIILDFTQCFWVIFILPKNITIEINVVDLNLVYFKRVKFFTNFLYPIYLFEKLVFNKANLINVMSIKDKKILEKVFHIAENKIKIIDHKLSPFVKNFRSTKNYKEKYSILFWGAMSRPENYKAIIKFVNFNFRKILSIYPSSKLFIVGSNPHASLMKLQNQFPNNIFITGFIKDPSDYFQKASIGIAPLYIGAGIKYKVLEMLACNLKVVSTRIGAEGIINKNLIINDDISNFHTTIINYWARSENHKN